MLKRNFLASSLLALVAAASAHAELNTLVVKTNPTTYEVGAGQVIQVTSLGNGYKRQSAFQLDRVTSLGDVPVNQQFWSSQNTYSINPTALRLPAGEYKLTVQARESGRREVLSKTQYFRIAGPALTACELIEGSTFTNAQPATAQFDLSCTNFLCSGITSQLLTGLSMLAPLKTPSLVNATFANGNVSIQPASLQLNTMLGSAIAQASSSLAGSYTCTGNTVTFNASGSASVTSGGSSLMSLFGGLSFPLSVAGSLTIDPVNRTLSGGGAILSSQPLR